MELRKRYVNAYAFALGQAAVNDKNQAFQWLEKGCQAHAPGLILLEAGPGLDNVPSDLRYEDLPRRISGETARSLRQR